MAHLVEERREARRRKILDNADKRMQKILTSEDGKLRQEPGLEDGPYRNISEQQNPAAPKAEDASSLTSPSRNAATAKLSSEDQRTMPVHTWNDQALADNKPFERPRVVLAAILGALMAIILNAIASRTGNIIVPWVIYEFCMESLFYYVAAHMHHMPPYPSHGHVVNTLQAFGASERWVRIGGRLAEMMSRILDDTVTMLLVLLITDAAYNKLIG